MRIGCPRPSMRERPNERVRSERFRELWPKEGIPPRDSAKCLRDRKASQRPGVGSRRRVGCPSMRLKFQTSAASR